MVIIGGCSMSDVKSLLKIAGILNCILGIIAINIPFFGIITLILGIILYLSSKLEDEKIIENKTFFPVIAIICIPFNLVSAIILFVASYDINQYIKSNGKKAPPKKTIEENKENKKIDLLLKLGVGMVFISGVIFATTTWDIMTNYAKTLILLILGLLFICLSLFTEEKLKLYKSSYLYWLLSMSFFTFTIVSMLHYGVFGLYLTYSGSGKYLANFITCLTIAGLAFTTYLKYSKKYLLFGIYLSLTLAIYNLFIFLKLTPITILSIISVIVMIINIISSKKSILFSFSKIISIVLFVFIINNISSSSEISILIASIINIINLNTLILLEDNKEEPIIYIILTYILIYTGIIPLTILGKYSPLVVSLITALYTFLINNSIVRTKDDEKKLNHIFYSITTLITFIISAYNFPIVTPIIIIIYIFINTTTKYELFKTKKIELSKYFEPISFFLLITSFYINISSKINLINVSVISSLLYCALSIIYTDEEDKDIYYIFSIISLTISLITNSVIKDIFISLISILSALLLFAKSYITNKNRVYQILSYIILLTSIYIPFIVLNILEINLIFITLIFIILMLIVLMLLKNPIINKITLFYIALPIFTLLNKQSFTYEIDLILISILNLYFTFLLIKLFIKNTSAKNILGIIGILYSISEVLFINNIYIGIYIGIVGLIIIFIGYINKSLMPIFKFGVILTIVNIIIQLKDLWNAIPFWLYLLTCGIAIISFVTYKEIKK